MSVAVPVVDHWDGGTRRIFLRQGVTSFNWLDDIYTEYRYWRRTDESSRKWLPFMKASGNEPKGGGKFTPRYITLLDGTRCVPFNEDVLITVTGEAITDNADVDPSPFDTTTRTQPLKLYITPPAAEIVRDTKSLEAIGHMEFNDMIFLDATLGHAGTGLTTSGLQIGTQRAPSNNLMDAKAIAAIKGFSIIRLKKNLTVAATESVNGLIVIGDGVENSKVVLTAGCTTSKTEFRHMSISGAQDGETHYDHCEIKELFNVHCKFEDCLLVGPMHMEAGTFVDTTVLINCYTGWDKTIVAPAAKDEFVVDMNGSSVNMAFSNFHGKIKFINLNHVTTPGVVLMNITAGKATVDSSCTTSVIKLRGNYELVNNSGGTIIDDDSTASLVWLHPSGVMAAQAELSRKMQTNKAVISSDGSTVTIYDDDNISILRQFTVSPDKNTRTPI